MVCHQKMFGNHWFSAVFIAHQVLNLVLLPMASCCQLNVAACLCIFFANFWSITITIVSLMLLHVQTSMKFKKIGGAMLTACRFLDL